VAQDSRGAELAETHGPHDSRLLYAVESAARDSK
jgi:hypothetical protein